MRRLFFVVYRFFYLFLAAMLVISACLAEYFTESIFFYGVILLVPTLAVTTTLFACISYIKDDDKEKLKNQIKYLEGFNAFLWVMTFLTLFMLGISSVTSPFFS